ncbi:MAG: peptide ABC transporter substrate-binding protein, partial [Carnobacterium jeotgali]
MKKNKLISLLGLTATSALVLAACGSGNDGEKASSENKASGSGEEQVLNLIESAELPNMDSAKSTDVVSGTVLNNVNEGLYRQNPENELELGMAAEEPEV